MLFEDYVTLTSNKRKYTTTCTSRDEWVALITSELRTQYIARSIHACLEQ